MLIRDASVGDLGAIFAIYDREVLHGTATFETTARSERERLEWFQSLDRGRYPVIVAGVTFIIGAIFIRETRDHRISTL